MHSRKKNSVGKLAPISTNIVVNKQGNASFVAKTNAQSVDNIELKQGLLITELSNKEAPYGQLQDKRMLSPYHQKNLMANKTSLGFNTLAHASLKTEQSIESFQTIGGRKEMLLEKDA